MSTPVEIEREIRAQVRDGYDLIKFHELPRTTGGLPRASYRTMIETARAANIPLLGHAPVNLGAETWLDARQAVAHTGMLTNIYFLPVMGNVPLVMTTAASLGVLTLLSVIPYRRVPVIAAAALAWSEVAVLGAVLPVVHYSRARPCAE